MVKRIPIIIVLGVLSACASPFGTKSTVDGQWACQPSPSGPCRSMSTIDQEISRANGETDQFGGVSHSGGHLGVLGRPSVPPPSDLDRLLKVSVEPYVDGDGVYHGASELRTSVPVRTVSREVPYGPQPVAKAQYDGEDARQAPVHLPAADGSSAKRKRGFFGLFAKKGS